MNEIANRAREAANHSSVAALQLLVCADEIDRLQLVVDAAVRWAESRDIHEEGGLQEAVIRAVETYQTSRR